ncbi:hypothetical protein CDAR_415761 [Caerostris darwini]|uniref:Uncharacterized protein n=1 Tax=Caerostris darwini TaxID=1538125 RepID=A0AAV4SM73_9ARAC|nr:hypothetical protein CDAR_415761 [Caerostris darwini]
MTSPVSPSLKQCNENKVGRKEIEIKWGDETPTEGMNSIWRVEVGVVGDIPSISFRVRNVIGSVKWHFGSSAHFFVWLEETLLINIVAFGLRHAAPTEWWVGRVLVQKIFSTLNSCANTLGILNVYLKYFDIF